MNDEAVSKTPQAEALDRICEDETYSAQAYYEAAKSADFFGKGLVFVSAVISSISSLSLALSAPKWIGAFGAAAGAVAATASLLGSDKRATSYKDAAKRFTVLRHRANYERGVVAQLSGDSADAVVRSLLDDYNEIVQIAEPVPNRLFERAQRRIQAGTLSCEPSKGND